MLDSLPLELVQHILSYLDAWDIHYIESKIESKLNMQFSLFDLCIHTMCEGCKNQEPNQEAHMGPGGCLE